MRFTCQIRKYISVTAAAALSACMLFGCTRSDTASSSQNAAGGNSAAGQDTVTSTSDGQSLAGAGSSQSSQSTSAAAPAAEPASQESQSASAPVPQQAQTVSGTTTQTPVQNTVSEQSQTPAAGEDMPVVVIDAPEEEDAEESFSGEYERSDGGESVTISLINDNQISFQFRESGIGAVADASGSSAVYTGDDGYRLSFDVAGDTLAVSVSGEGGEESPMNGIYYRVVDGGDNADDYDDADDDYDDDLDEEYIEQDSDEEEDTAWDDAE